MSFSSIFPLFFSVKFLRFWVLSSIFIPLAPCFQLYMYISKHIPLLTLLSINCSTILRHSQFDQSQQLTQNPSGQNICNMTTKNTFSDNQMAFQSLPNPGFSIMENVWKGIYFVEEALCWALQLKTFFHNNFDRKPSSSFGSSQDNLGRCKCSREKSQFKLDLLCLGLLRSSKYPAQFY